jgi:hypothetical protein
VEWSALSLGWPACDRDPGTATADLVASTAWKISWVAASGCETKETCESGTSMMVALARSAMNRCSAGGMALSSQDGVEPVDEPSNGEMQDEVADQEDARVLESQRP